MSRLLVVSVLMLLVSMLTPAYSSSQIVDFCGSTAVSNGGCLLICPTGDGDFLSGIDATISVTVIYEGNPIPNIPAADFWLIGCDPTDEMILCGGSASSNADAPTDPMGRTTISGPISAGGCSEGLAVVVQGIVLPDPNAGCTTWICLPVAVRSPDLDGNLIVELPDLALFAAAFNQPPYEPCADFNCDTVVGLQDLAFFAAHFAVPRHGCGS